MGREGPLQYGALSPKAVGTFAHRLLARFPHVRRVVLLTNSGIDDDLDELRCAHCRRARCAPRARVPCGTARGRAQRPSRARRRVRPETQSDPAVRARRARAPGGGG
eukprot:6687735-Prymnesium_polylepis.1